MRFRRLVLGCLAALIVLASGCGTSLVGDDPADDPEAVFEAFWSAYDRHYAHFHLKSIDWDGVYDEYRPQVGPQTTDEELFGVLSQMLSVLEDGHVYLVGDGRRTVSNRHLRAGKMTFDPDVVRHSYLQHEGTGVAEGRIHYGRIADSLGYVRLSTLSGGDGFGGTARGWIEEFESVMSDLSSADAIIVDLRNNGGGRASNAQFVAAEFATSRRRFLVTRSRNGPGHDDFSAPRHWYAQPASNQSFSRPVVVLTNRRTFSAAEWLTLALRQYDHVTHMGTHTGGGLAMFLPRQLPNGWMHTVSVQDTRGPNGRSFERVGIAPHRYLETDGDGLANGRDRMLDGAIKYLQGRVDSGQ